MIDPIALIEAIATVFWVYATVALVEWLWLMRRLEAQLHVSQVAELLSNLVPVAVALIVVVMVGALVGLPSVVVIIALMFPAGLLFALTLSLNDMRTTSARTELLRLALVLALSAAVIWWRQGG